jgi:tyrosyl-tRNA synthetase
MHGPDAAKEAQADWDRRRRHETPIDMPEVQVGPGPHKIAPVLVKAGLAASNGEGVRKVKEGAVKIDGEKVTDFQKELTFAQPTVIQLGRKYVRVTP